MLHWTHTNTPNGTSIGSAVSARLIDVPNTQTGNTRQTRVATAGCAYMQCMLNYAYCAAQATCRPIHGLIAACTCWCHAWTTDKSTLPRDCSCNDFAWQISCLSLHRLQCVSQVAGLSPLVSDHRKQTGLVYRWIPANARSWLLRAEKATGKLGSRTSRRLLLPRGSNITNTGSCRTRWIKNDS